MRKYNEAQGTLERAKTAELSQAQALAEARRHTDDATQMVGGSLFANDRASSRHFSLAATNFV
mgnify:CR=1 FL=1